MSYLVRSDCRLCGSTALTKVLELPPTPLANEFPTKPNVDQEKFPLWLALCGGCGHVQLPVVVNPERLFRDYVYVSGTSPVFVEHFRRYADDLAKDLKPGDLVVEIGSNDGTLLRFFKEKGMHVLGIDPAQEIAARATADGIETWTLFFDETVAEQVQNHARALGTEVKLVVANNVFAHADDLAGIARGVKRMLAEDGRFAFEVSYLRDVVEKSLFDLQYHEHLSHHSARPLFPFLNRHGLYPDRFDRVDTHGGSLRVTARPMPHARMLNSEEAHSFGLSEGVAKLDRPETFAALAKTIAERKDELLRVLRGARMAGKRIAAYGAPAKATTLLHTFGIEHGMLDFVVDDSPHKQGRYLPGTDIQVLPSSAIGDRKPDYVCVLAWNFSDSILDKLAPYRAAGGKCIVPLPKVRVID